MGQVQSSLLLALTSLPVWMVVIRWMWKTSWWLKLGAHVCIAPPYVFLNWLLYREVLTYVAGIEAVAAVERVHTWILVTYGISYVIQFAIYHGVETFRQLQFRERQTAQLVALTREQELAVLKSQINPHFFFNTLNSISAMASSDVETTRSMIAQLGDLLRYAMESSRHNLVPLREELEFVKSYIDLERKRLAERLTVVYDVPDDVLDNLIPALSIQPLVENAIKHGIEPSERGGIISLSVSSDQRSVSVRVHNTALGVDSRTIMPTKNGIGLKNTEARLQTLFGKASEMWYKGTGKEGVEVGFTVPVRR